MYTKITSTKELNEETKKELLELWNTEYPQNLSYHNTTEFNDYLNSLLNPTHYFLTNRDESICGWAFMFHRENERWFAIILSEKIKGNGFGRKILDELKQHAQVLNGWVIDHNNDYKKNGQKYLSPLKFYEKCGFEILQNERLELAKISAVKIRWEKN